MTSLQTAFANVILIPWILMAKLLIYSNSTLGTDPLIVRKPVIRCWLYCICFLVILSVLHHILVFTKSSYGVWTLHTQLFIPVLPDFTTSALRSAPAGLCASPASASLPLRPDLRQLLWRIKSGLLNKYSSAALRQGPGAGSISGAPLLRANHPWGEAGGRAPV